MKLLSLLLLLAITISANAKTESVSQLNSYANEMQNEIFINAQRLKRVASKISIKKPGFFSRIGNSEAVYIPRSKKIILKKELFTSSGNVKNLYQLRGPRLSYSYQTKAITIFHELSHAEMDVLISYDNTYNFNSFMHRTVQNWFGKNYRANAYLAMQELYGYSTEGLLTTLFNNVDAILMLHGLNLVKRSCLSEETLVKIAERLNLHEKLEFKPAPANRYKDYKDHFLAKRFYIDAKEFRLKSTFPQAWKQRIFNHFVEKYGIPRDTNDMVTKMNSSPFYQNLLKSCYKNILK